MNLQMDIIHTEHTCADSCPAKNGTDLYQSCHRNVKTYKLNHENGVIT